MKGNLWTVTKLQELYRHMQDAVHHSNDSSHQPKILVARIPDERRNSKYQSMLPLNEGWNLSLERGATVRQYLIWDIQVYRFYTDNIENENNPHFWLEETEKLILALVIPF